MDKPVLRESGSLQRAIRQEGWDAQGIPTWTMLSEAIRQGEKEEALQLLNYGIGESRKIYNTLMRFVNLWLDYAADKWGEEIVPELWQAVRSNPKSDQPSSDMSRALGNVAEMVRLDAEMARGTYSGNSNLGNFSITEEADRYVVTVDPCGTGGMIRRSGLYGKTKKGYPWSWGLPGVSYHCVHCALHWEIMPIKQFGYPFRVHENVDKPEKACMRIYYKRPELIPEHYYTRVGLKKTI